VGLRWAIGPGAWNCLRSVLARACGSSAVGLSASGYRSAGGHKNESNTESLEHRVSPQIFLTSEEPRGFSDELILPRGHSGGEQAAGAVEPGPKDRNAGRMDHLSRIKIHMQTTEDLASTQLHQKGGAA